MEYNKIYDEVLIGFVQNNPELFIKKHPKYANRVHCNKIWDKIAAEINEAY